MEISLDSSELAPFLRTIWERRLLELLKADGLTTLNEATCLSRLELYDLPNIGRHRVDDVVDLLDRSCTGLGWGIDPQIIGSPFAGSDRASGKGFDPAGSRRMIGSSTPAPTRETVGLGPPVAASILSEFPSLALIAGRPLSDPLLRAAWTEQGDDLAHSWLAKTGATLVGDVLPLTRQDLLNLRGLGPSKVYRLYAYLGRLADIASTLAAWDVVPAAGVPEAPLTRVDRDANLQTIVTWASSVAGVSTWGEALAVLADSVPVDVAAAREELLAEVLPATDGESPLSAFLADDPRRARVLIGRVASSEPLTLQSVASELGVTRERVRQIESKGLARLRSEFDSAPSWRIVRWAAERVVTSAGGYAPSEVLERVLPNWEWAERRLVAHLAGYSSFEPVLLLDGFKLPTVAELPKVAETDFVVDEYELIERLRSLGVIMPYIELVLASLSGVSRVDGQLVLWGGSVADKAVAVLEVRDEVQDIDHLVSLAYGEGGSRSARNRILEDPRLMRATKNKVGLRRWGGAQYTGVAELMLERLASGPMDLDELAEELAKRYEVASASVRMYAAAPAFKCTGDTVALRSRLEPYVPRDAPWKVRGLYRQQEARTTVWCVEVDSDMLRGSGRTVPQEIALDLDLLPGGRIDLATKAGPIPLSWSETANSGPRIGSIRELLRISGLSLGDQVGLQFQLEARELQLQPIFDMPRANLIRRLSRLTSLPESALAGQAQVAESVCVPLAELVSVLEARGDAEVASIVARLPIG